MTTNIKDLHILIVDDDKLLRSLLTRIAQSLGVKLIATATDGKQALAYLQHSKNKVDIIFTDLHMPGMDGIEFLRHLVAINSKSKVVLISAAHEQVLKTAGELTRAYGLNLLGVLPKPITPAHMRELLERSDIDAPYEAETTATNVDVTDLRQALLRSEIKAFFQPVVALRNGRLIGVEALARWFHPDLGPIPCECFIPLAERSGLIKELTETIISQSMAQAADWQRQGLDINLAINFSVHVLDQLQIPDYLECMISKAGLVPNQITVEITESDALQDIPAVLDVLIRLRMKGIGLAIDDFGTGYSSMQQLKRFPFTELKIDRLFVTGAADDAETLVMLESHLKMAQALHLTAVAEGVESFEDWRQIAKLGCKLAQGFYIAKAMPGDELSDWYKSRKSLS